MSRRRKKRPSQKRIGTRTEPWAPGRQPFREWLAEREGEESFVGRFARAVAADPCWPDTENYRLLKDHLEDHAAGDEAFTALYRAWTRWQGLEV